METKRVIANTYKALKWYEWAESNGLYFRPKRNDLPIAYREIIRQDTITFSFGFEPKVL